MNRGTVEPFLAVALLAFPFKVRSFGEELRGSFKEVLGLPSGNAPGTIR